MSLFETGDVVMTCGIRNMMIDDVRAFDAVRSCLERHRAGDWGDLCDEDKQLNEDSLEEERKGGCPDRLFSSYETDYGNIFVITECDRSVTTILLPEEYV